VTPATPDAIGIVVADLECQRNAVLRDLDSNGFALYAVLEAASESG
jgi:hypothetical protein